MRRLHSTVSLRLAVACTSTGPCCVLRKSTVNVKCCCNVTHTGFKLSRVGIVP